jgi:Type IV secretion system pilin
VRSAADARVGNPSPELLRTWTRILVVALYAVLLLALLAPFPADAAAADLTSVIESIRNWVAGILAALATLFLTVGGVRYLIAGGNPRAMEEGKAAIRSALIGYALAALAPMFVDIVRRVLSA